MILILLYIPVRSLQYVFYRCLSYDIEGCVTQCMEAYLCRPSLSQTVVVEFRRPETIRATGSLTCTWRACERTFSTNVLLSCILYWY